MTDLPDNRRGGLLAALLSLVLLGVVTFSYLSGPQERPTAGGPGRLDEHVDPAVGVTLTSQIDGTEFDSLTLPLSGEMTVLEMMQQAAEREPAWEFQYQDQGEWALLTKLAGRKNDGGSGRYWIYQVNGETADESFGSYQLSPGDHVLWKYSASE